MSGYLKLSAICADLDISDKTLRRIIGRGELPALRSGSVLRVPKGSYEEWKRSRLVPAQPEAVPERPVLRLRRIPRPRRQEV
ncbi:helix-turn-helix domain-containing protein [Inquilinus sp.]|uniref:helix-turn-helix domain-containing protein n=1 Tax=Inquilinus sp. TaxID=1932117 RepID=UPI0037835625